MSILELIHQSTIVFFEFAHLNANPIPQLRDEKQFNRVTHFLDQKAIEPGGRALGKGLVPQALFLI